MINLLIGAPGGGKSYEACVYHILPALQRGRKVITNLPVNVEMFAALDPAYRDLLEVRRLPQLVRGRWAAGTDGPAFVVEGEPKDPPASQRLFSKVWDYWTDWKHKSGMGPLFVIDECQLALPRGKLDQHVAEWYSLHRHYNVDVLLLTQAYGRIDSAVVDLVQLVYRVRKAVAFGMEKKYIRKVQDGIRGEVVQTSMREYDPKYFPLYKSHTQGSSVAEQEASDTRPIWMHPTFMGAGVCALLVAYSIATSVFSKPKAPPLPPITETLTPAQRADIAANPVLLPTSVDPAAVPAAAPSPEPAAPPVAEPYAAFGLHLTGSLTRRDGSAVYAFAVSRQGAYLYHATSEDLAAAGYKFRALAHCVGELSFGGVKRVVICDTPQVSLALGAPGSAVHTVSASSSMPDPLSALGAQRGREGTPLAGSGSGARSAP